MLEKADQRQFLIDKQVSQNEINSQVSPQRIPFTNIQNQSLRKDVSNINNSNFNSSFFSPNGSPHRSRTQIILDYAIVVPARYVKEQMRPGGLNSSIFSLVVLSVGAGTLTIPFVFYQNGLIIGSLLLIFGALLSVYTGTLLVSCCEKTDAERYEDIALKSYGQRFSKITAISMLLCLIGFGIAYIILVLIIQVNRISIVCRIDATQNRNYNRTTTTTLHGQVIRRQNLLVFHFFSKLYSFSNYFQYCFVFPISLARQLSALRYTSLFSLLISAFVIFSIVFISIFDRSINYDFESSFTEALHNDNLSAIGIFESFPLIIFSFMYQPNIPMIYKELENKDSKAMKKVLIIGTMITVILYLLAGIFGYTTFARYPNVDELMNKQNILLCYPNSTINSISMFGILLVVLFATPLTILPCKDSVEEIFLKNHKLNDRQNVVTTLIIVTICFVLSLTIPNMGDALTILGATTNSAVGFIFPVIFYMKLQKDNGSLRLYQKVIGYIVVAFISCSSVIELAAFIHKKIDQSQYN